MYDKNQIKLSFLAAAYIGEYIYFSAMYINGLFRYSMKTGICEYLTSFEKDVIAVCLHRRVFVYENQLFFMPWEAKYVSIYNIDTNEMSYIDASDFKKGQFTFIDGTIDCEKLYFIPYQGEKIMIVHLNNYKTDYFEVPIEIGNQIKIGGTVYRNYIYIFTDQGEAIGFDLVNHEKKIIMNCEGSSKYESILENEQCVWLIPYEGQSFIMFDKGCETIKKYTMDREFGYLHGMFLGEKLFFFPRGENRNIMIINFESDDINIVKQLVDTNAEMLEMMKVEGNNSKYNIIADNDGKIFIYDNIGKILKKMYVTMERDKYFDKVIASQELRHVFHNMSSEEKIFFEGNGFSIGAFIEML